MRLYPLDPATNAERSITLRTGFAPPSIATVEAHVSARNHGPDVRLIIGKEELMEAIDPKKAVATAAGEVENADHAVAGGDGATGEGGASKPRSIVLELEIFACGAINVRRLMEIIKGCFEQVFTVKGYLLRVCATCCVFANFRDKIVPPCLQWWSRCAFVLRFAFRCVDMEYTYNLHPSEFYVDETYRNNAHAIHMPTQGRGTTRLRCDAVALTSLLHSSIFVTES